MRFILQISVASSLMILHQGCANVSVTRVTSRDQPGIRYWRPAPYISLTSVNKDGSSSCDAKIVFLPDKSEEYSITMDAGIGTAEASPTLQDGWNLTGLTGKADSKTAENLTAIASLVKSVAPGGLLGGSASKGSTKDQRQAKCGGLLKIDYDASTGQVTGFTPIGLPL